jgi:hypothetical protein
VPRRVTERIGFHYEGQYMEVEVRAGLPAAFYVDGVEIEPTLEMVKFATAAVRRNGGRNIERQH